MRSHHKKSRKALWHWLPGLCLVLLLAAVYYLLDAPGQARAAAATLQPSELAEDAGGQRELPEAAAQPASAQEEKEALRTPPGREGYAASARPDGRTVTPKDDLCYWGMELLDASAQIHRCRFKSGSGQLLPDYSWGQKVPESEAVDQDYFSDSVFIGNSLAQGFMLYGKLKTADMFAMQSISVGNIATEKVINTGSGSYISILDAMALKSYGKVFVMLGINELSWASKDTFYTKYADLIDRIRELEPEAEIYLQSMTPVTEKQSNASTTFTNERIHDYNEVIRQLAEDKEAHYIYLFDAFADETGCLPAGSSDDGIHPYPKYYAQWLTYLQSHTVTEVKR